VRRCEAARSALAHELPQDGPIGSVEPSKQVQMKSHLNPLHSALLGTATSLLALHATAQPELVEEPEPAEAPASAAEEAPPPSDDSSPPPDPAATTAPLATVPVAPPTPAEVEVAPPPAPAPEPEFLPLKVSGSIWSRYELRSGYRDHGLTQHPRFHREGDYIVSRARLGLSTNPVDVGEGVRISGTFVPQAAWTMGADPGLQTIYDQPNVTVYEGYASVGTDSYKLDIGRIMLNYGDALIIGNLDWNEAARSFNGGRLRLTPGASPYYVDVLGTIVNEGRLATNAPFQGDAYFWGVYAGLGPAISPDLELDAYFLGQSFARADDITVIDPDDPTNTAIGDQVSATDLTVGARLKGKAGAIDYRAEAGMQFGARPVPPTIADLDPEARSKFAYHADAEIGFSPVKPFRIGIEGLVASGDDLSTPDRDEGWNELYPTTHKWLGLMDVPPGHGGFPAAVRTNMMSAVLHLKYAFTDSLTALLDAHYFSRPEANAAGRDGTLGQEIDTQLLYAIGKGFGVRGLYGVFFPDADYWEGTATPDGPLSRADASAPIHYVELQFGYDFK
jgi:hypothetical protein